CLETFVRPRRYIRIANETDLPPPNRCSGAGVLRLPANYPVPISAPCLPEQSESPRGRLVMQPPKGDDRCPSHPGSANYCDRGLSRALIPHPSAKLMHAQWRRTVIGTHNAARKGVDTGRIASFTARSHIGVDASPANHTTESKGGTQTTAGTVEIDGGSGA